MQLAISGPNASGKTTLCQALAQHFDAPVVSEDVQPLFRARSQLQRLQKAFLDKERATQKSGDIEAPGKVASEKGSSKTKSPDTSALIDARKACARVFLEWMAHREAQLAKGTACVADRWGADILDMWLIFFGREGWADPVTKSLINSVYKQAEALDLVIITPFTEPFVGEKNEQGMQRASQFSNRYLNSMLTRGIISSIPKLKVLRLPVKPSEIDDRLDQVARAVTQLGLS